MNRASGVLMHISSLPGAYSIGSFGQEAKHFVDRLAAGGFAYWQTLPFCMTDECNSPYKSYSAFGGNPYFIDLPTLEEQGLLTKEELDEARQTSPWLCEFSRLHRERLPLLKKAAQRAYQNATLKKAMDAFLTEWPELADAARFLALREANGDREWQEWTVEEADGEALFAWQFIQYEFFRQWQTIKSYANQKGIRVVGDIPIYVALDSCDVWANRSQFQLDQRNRPTAVAGVPPDYFSEEGQLWNNPLYDWKTMKKDGYAWWSRRMAYMLTLFDGVRIDHFRGLESYWSVPAGAKTAKEGKWVKGPGRAFVDRLKEVANGRLIIAEDLGDITPAVYSLLQYSGLPGMRVIQFAFLGDPESIHLPHTYPNHCVAYTGTHDNNTLLGYLWETDEVSRRRIFAYCGYEGEDWREGCYAVMRTMLQSHADTVIFPIQDLLRYGADTRMNTPGTSERNWAYRVTEEQLNEIDMEAWNARNDLYGRR
ncbi:MAG: 4-alpha-glucanotransferase [Clostridia bacterium]|nr:4-alpha-glucanotransferase [Clostridia bacterium]